MEADIKIELQQESTAGLCIGDWIECDFTHPNEHTRAAQLNTPDAMLYGLQLLSDPKSRWRRATRHWSVSKASELIQATS